MNATQRRDGCMRRRSDRTRFTPELGYYIIVTDAAKTEKHFFEGLRDALPECMARKLSIKVHAGIVPEELVSFCLGQVARNPHYAQPWIVIDCDEVAGFDRLVREADSCGIRVAWSNQCFEVWMSLYLGPIIHAESSQRCIDRFSDAFKKATKRPYRKNDKELYHLLCRFGNESRAIEQSRQRYGEASRTCTVPSRMVPCSTVHELVDEIRQKVQ